MDFLRLLTEPRSDLMRRVAAQEQERQRFLQGPARAPLYPSANGGHSAENFYFDEKGVGMSRHPAGMSMMSDEQAEEILRKQREDAWLQALGQRV